MGADSGTTFLAGHVNHPDGRLSPWGRLHEIGPCAQIFAAGTDGEVHEYRVTDLFIVPQDRLREHPDVVSRRGPPRVVLVTCSGPERPGVVEGLRQYDDNLVIAARLVDDGVEAGHEGPDLLDLGTGPDRLRAT